MMSDAFDAFVGVNIVGIGTRWIFAVIHNSPYRALIYTRTARDTNIGNLYSHNFSLIEIFNQKILL